MSQEQSAALLLLQMWLRMAAMVFFTLCLVLLWLVGVGWCSSVEFCWLGLMPMQIVMTVNTVVLCYVASPRTAQEHAAASVVRFPPWLSPLPSLPSPPPVRPKALLEATFSLFLTAACVISTDLRLPAHIQTTNKTMNKQTLCVCCLRNGILFVA